MRTKLAVDTFILQRNRTTIAADQSSIITADSTINPANDISVIMTAHENVSISIKEQSSNTFLIITSDTTNSTTDYIIASSS